jgi:rhamnosyltransferase
MPCATVVVPVLNGAEHLPALLDALAKQGPATEVLAIDSGSSDASVSILERATVRLLRIAPGAFDHGETRNLGAREARGKFVLFLSQDALPADATFVARLVSALESDERLAGAFARQLPRSDADPLTKRDLAAWVAAASEPRTVILSEASCHALTPLERYRLTAFDNVASAVRRKVLLAHPFGPTRFGEDIEWGSRVLRLGYGIAYVPGAVVVHSHRRTARGLLRRNYLCHRVLFRLFGLRTIPDLPHLARALLGSLSSDLATLARDGGRPGQWLRAPVQAAAAAYGQYRGSRDERLGRPYPRWA